MSYKSVDTAIEMEDWAQVKTMLESKATVRCWDYVNREIGKYGNPDLLQLLHPYEEIEGCVYHELSYSTILLEALSHQNIPVVKWVVENKRDNVDQFGYDELISHYQTLIKAGYDDYDEIALAAIAHNNISLLYQMIDLGIKSYANIIRELYSEGYRDIVEDLMGKVEMDNDILACITVTYNDIKMLKKLLTKRTDVSSILRTAYKHNNRDALNAIMEKYGRDYPRLHLHKDNAILDWIYSA